MKPPATIHIFWCSACGWEDQTWGAQFWRHHREAGEAPRLVLPCLDGGDETNVHRVAYKLVERAVGVSASPERTDAA